MSAGPAFRAILRANGALLALLGDRVYPFGGVRENAPRPYVEFGIASSTPSDCLDGKTISKHYDAVSARVVCDDYDQVWAILNLFPACFLAVADGSFGGVTVEACEVTEASDSSEGPVDIDGRRAFEGLATVVIAYH